ncbi:MAG: right-handed parallel beta-helix repeat-containing protein [Acidobacteriia bacterium]|nr:right-handed parallel beta-helix repeat-containing protein [Terriglobia bacterium]
MSGAILNGSIQITSFVPSGSYWVIPNQSQKGIVIGDCGTTSPMCSHPESVYFDNQPLQPVANLSSLASGTFFFDYQNNVIYLADNPNNHTVEVSVVPAAISGSAQNVTVQGLTIEKFSNPGQYGAVGGLYPGPGWIVQNNEIRLNHGAGVTLSSNGQASGNYIHHNGEIGITTGDTTYQQMYSLLVQNNELAYNNWAGYNLGWASGGLKLANAVGPIIRNNYVHDNLGMGLWTDQNSSNVLYDSNRVQNNTGDGIHHELSYSATISNNIITGNYWPGNPWYWGAQIMIQNSSNVIAYNNTLEVLADRGNGIVIVQQNRGGPWISANNYIHDNTITYDGAQGGTGSAGDYLVAQLISTNNNVFQSNHYKAPDTTAYHWTWDQPKNWAGFQADGQDTQGTLSH